MTENTPSRRRWVEGEPFTERLPEYSPESIAGLHADDLLELAATVNAQVAATLDHALDLEASR